MKGTKSDITIIFNIWKRPYLEEQVKAVLSQTTQPDLFWLTQNESHIDTEKVLSNYRFIKKIHAEIDFKYFFRFSIAMFCSTKYVWIIDDDVIPSKFWLEGCIELCESTDSIVCSSGRIIPHGNYHPERIVDQSHISNYFIGDGDNRFRRNYCAATTTVDFGCNSWFIKKEWLRHFWAVSPYSFETGEDIHLSASCNFRGNIKTIVPKQIDESFCGNLNRTYGFDKYASFLRGDFLECRSAILKNMINENKWKPLNW